MKETNGIIKKAITDLERRIRKNESRDENTFTNAFLQDERLSELLSNLKELLFLEDEGEQSLTRFAELSKADYKLLSLWLDEIRKAVWNLDHDQEQPENWSKHTLFEEYFHIREQLEKLYKACFSLYPNQLDALPFDRSEFAQLIKREKKFGFPIAQAPVEYKGKPPVPEIDDYYTPVKGNIEEVVAELAKPGNISYCISGRDPGDQNAGVGKTTLAKGIVKLISSEEPIERFEYTSKFSVAACDTIYDLREKFSEGVIWLSLDKYSENETEYVLKIAEAAGIKYHEKSSNFSHGVAEKQPQDAVTKKIRQEKSREIDFGLTLDSDEVIKSTNIQFDEIFAQKSEEELQEELHGKVDSLEKLALKLVRRKFLIVIDNAEQNRKVLHKLYVRLRYFCSVLITCRIELPGIPTYHLKPFDNKTALLYWKKINQGKEEVPKDELKKVFKKLRYNPFCIQIVGFNYQPPFSNVARDLIGIDASISRLTTRLIAECLRITKALEGIQELLFDASLFLGRTFDGRRLSYYQVDKTAEEISNKLRAIHDNRRIIGEQGFSETGEVLYEFQQGFSSYLEILFEREEGLSTDEEEQGASTNSVKKIDQLKGKIKKSKENLKEIPHENERLKLLIKILRYQKYINHLINANIGSEDKHEAPLQESKVSYAEIIYEAFDTSIQKVRYFAQKGLAEDPISHSYYFYCLANADYKDADYFSAMRKSDEYLRYSALTEWGNFYGGVFLTIKRDVLISHLDEFSLDALVSEMINKGLSRNTGNKINCILSLTHMSKLYGYDEVDKITVFELLREIVENRDQEYNVLSSFYRTIFKDDPQFLTRYREEFKEKTKLVKDNSIKLNAESDLLYHLAIEDWERAGVNFANIYPGSLEEMEQNPRTGIDAWEWSARLAIEKNDFSTAAIVIDKISKRFEEKRLLSFGVLREKLKTLLAVKQGNEREALSSTKELQRMLKSANLVLSAEDKKIFLKNDERLIIEQDHFKRSKSLFPDFLTLPSYVYDVDGNKMLHIPAGRSIVYKGGHNLVLDPAFCLAHVDEYLQGSWPLSQFNKEVFLPDFYVDEEPVTKEEYKAFLDSLPLEERPDNFVFNAKYVRKFAESKNKLPITEPEWQKIVEGVNYNLTNPLNIRKGINHTLEQEYHSLVEQTTLKCESETEIIPLLRNMKLGEGRIHIAGLEIDKALLQLVVYTLVFKDIYNITKIVNRLCKNEKHWEATFNVLRNNIKSLAEINARGNFLELKMIINSQQNIWKAALRYMLGLEKSFRVIPASKKGERVKEAIIKGEQSEKSATKTKPSVTSEAPAEEPSGAVSYLNQAKSDGEITETMYAKEYAKEADFKRISYQHTPISEKEFVPFRCVKMWYDVVEKSVV